MKTKAGLRAKKLTAKSYINSETNLPYTSGFLSLIVSLKFEKGNLQLIV
jgi:hypothetical protein